MRNFSPTLKIGQNGAFSNWLRIFKLENRHQANEAWIAALELNEEYL
ncbi:MAG: hypothetical protein ABIK92_12200 [Pseudomonadota bacterium]